MEIVVPVLDAADFAADRRILWQRHLLAHQGGLLFAHGVRAAMKGKIMWASSWQKSRYASAAVDTPPSPQLLLYAPRLLARILVYPLLSHPRIYFSGRLFQSGRR